jgi:dihydroorotate dehydrogenase
MVYEGPAVGSKIVSDLKKLLEEQGYSNVSEAVGSERPC